MNFETPSQDPDNNKEIENKKEIIKFPQSIDAIRALQNKLQEYKQRPDSLDRNYKVAVLGKLLTKGEVNKESIALELKERFGSLDIAIFKNAYGVIEDYATNEGLHTMGGTGLKTEKQDIFNKEIKDVENFEELFEILRFKGGLSGSSRHYSAEELIEKIENYRKSGYGIILKEITRTDGLRDKVEELFNKI